MSSNELLLDLEHVPKNCESKFRKILHATSFDNAKKILATGQIFGDFYGATPMHANFSFDHAIALKHSDYKEVLLHFDWQGDQCICFDKIVGKHGTLGYENILFHVYFRQDFEPFDPTKNYWQSVIFPGSNKLRFDKITILRSKNREVYKAIWFYPQLLLLNKTHTNKAIKVV